LIISVPRRTVLRVAVVLALMAALAASSVARLGARALPLAAPVLKPFDGKSHTDSYLLQGEIDSVRAGSWVRVYRNGVAVDSVSGAIDTLFSVRVPLVPGMNDVVTILRDAKFNESVPSNRVSINFDDRSGLFVPVPMVPGASFDVNTVEPAVKVELRIFDTTGDLVVKFESREPRTLHSFPWDGKNGSYQGVRRGPLVAVGAIDYPDGTHDVIRQVFLFDPEGSP
jgi:hypothetical protein